MQQDPSAYYNVQGSKKWKHFEILTNNKTWLKLEIILTFINEKNKSLKHLYKSEREFISFEFY
jgi:hypothetical protein